MKLVLTLASQDEDEMLPSPVRPPSPDPGADDVDSHCNKVSHHAHVSWNVEGVPAPPNFSKASLDLAHAHQLYALQMHRLGRGFKTLSILGGH
jgi:hypothetical protein